ncbi:Beta-ketoadipate enol-lactone hydrolase [Klebsiella pneumoniae]|nr:Beta-ketoadipate enol-lactone hydrolase [Klebsiella pneumoniae]
MAVVAAGAADRWFTHAFRQKAPEVVEALCHQLTHTDAEAMPPAVRRWPPPTCGAKWGRSRCRR